MGVLKLFEGTGDLYCAVATIKTSEGSMQKVVDGTAFSVGRAPECVLSIPDVGISRLHLLVTIKRGEIYITDQGSSNGTFLNGEKIESKRLIHVKATDEIKLGKSDVVLQFGCIEKHFKTDYIAESLLPAQEKDNLMSVIKASHHKAQEIVGMAQSQAEQLVKVATDKARNTENQTLLLQEEILSKAQVESQQIVSETKRKAAQMIVDAEENARKATEDIRNEAESRRQEAEMYYQQKIQESQTHGEQLVEKHRQMGQELVEGLKAKTIAEAERQAKEQLASLFTLLDQKSEELEKLKTECHKYSEEQRKVIEIELNEMRQEFLKKFEYEKQTTLDEHQSKVAMLEGDYLHKKQEFEEEESNRIQKLEDRIRKLNDKLDTEYAEKKVRLEREYAERTTSIDREFNQKKSKMEEDFQARQTKLTDDYERNKTEFTTSLEKQRSMLEKEVDSQRQTLQVIRTEIDDFSERHLEIKSKYESLTQTVKGLQKSETDLMQLLEEKRKHLASVQEEQKRVSDQITELDLKHTDLQKAHANLKTQFETDHLKFRKEIDLEMQRVRSEIKKKTSEYEDLERIKLEEYKTEIASQRKQLDLNFERTKKEYEFKTKDVIEFEKKKLEESKQQFLALMNNQRATVIDELTKSIIKIEKRGDPAHAPSLIAHAVTTVFDSNVAEFSLTANSQSSAESNRNLRAQWLVYGFTSAMALVFAFIFLIQPQINKHVTGTEENKAASVVKERPKFQPEQDLEYRGTYLDNVVYTSKFADIYLDDTIYDKWFKYITDYMFQTWRVPEEKSIEAAAMAKSLVDSLRTRSLSLDAEFAEKGLEKLREVEADTVKRMADTLGTQVKFEAFKRKEREFFEPYIQNQ